MNLVAIEKVKTYDRHLVKEGMVRLLAPLGGMPAFVRRGERVLLKPNMLAAKAPDAAVTTHPEILRAAIELVQEAGGRVLVGDSPGFGSIVKVGEKTGLLQVIRQTGGRTS